LYKQLLESKNLQFYIVESSGVFDNYNDEYMSYLKNSFILVLPKSRLIDKEIKNFSKKFEKKTIMLYIYGAKIYDDSSKNLDIMINGYPKDLFYKKYPVCLAESITIGNFKINTNNFDVYREYILKFYEKNILDCHITWSLRTINIKSIRKIKNIKKSESLMIQLKN